MSISLLFCFKDQIGISTPVLNALMDKYKNQYLKESDAAPKQPKPPKIKRVSEKKPKKVREPRGPKPRRLYYPKNRTMRKKSPLKNQEHRIKFRNRATVSAILQSNGNTVNKLPTQMFSPCVPTSKIKSTSSRKRVLVKDVLMQRYFNNATNLSEIVTPDVRFKSRKLTINKIFKTIEESSKTASNADASENDSSTTQVANTTSMRIAGEDKTTSPKASAKKVTPPTKTKTVNSNENAKKKASAKEDRATQNSSNIISISSTPTTTLASTSTSETIASIVVNASLSIPMSETSRPVTSPQEEINRDVFIVNLNDVEGDFFSD